MKPGNKGNGKGRWALWASCTAMIGAGPALYSISGKSHWFFNPPANVCLHVIQNTTVILNAFRVSILTEIFFAGAEIVHG
jgi:hypothetical protein